MRRFPLVVLLLLFPFPVHGQTGDGSLPMDQDSNKVYSPRYAELRNLQPARALQLTIYFRY